MAGFRSARDFPGECQTIEGAQHPDRDAQFGYINDQAKDHMGAGDPVISVDTKKKKLSSRYSAGPQAGRGNSGVQANGAWPQVQQCARPGGRAIAVTCSLPRTAMVTHAAFGIRFTADRPCLRFRSADSS